MYRFFIAGLLSLSLLAHGQNHAIMQYTVMDGLPQSQVNMVLEDAYGYLWIGTHGGGLARFDGREFKIYTTRDGLLNNVIHYLKLDSKNNLWIVHPKGITRFNGHTFTKFQQQNVPLRRVRRVFEARDTIYLVNNQGGLGAIHGDSVLYWNEPVSSDKRILYTHRVPDGSIALYLSDSSFMVTSGQWHNTVVSHKPYFGRLQNIFNRGNRVVLNTEKGFFELDFASKTFVPANIPIKNHILGYDDRGHSFWTRHESTLLHEQFDHGRHRIDTVLQNLTITQVFFDAEGNTWIATAGRGLFKYFKQDFQSWRLPSKVESVTAIEKDNTGAFWVGTASSGLWRVAGGEIVEYKANELNDYNINDITTDHAGRLWVGAYGGIAVYLNDTDQFNWYTRADGLPSSYVNQIEVDGRNNVWYATQGGGCGYFDGKQFTTFDVADGLHTRNVTAIHYCDFNTTMYAGGDNGLYSIVNKQVRLVEIPELENTSILSINDYEQRWLLLGTGGAGVIIWDPVTGQKFIIDSRNGLSSDFVYFVVADTESNLWIGTEKGVSRLRLSDQMTIEKYLHFGVENGLTGLQTNQNAYYVGEIKCFGLVDGVYQFNDIPEENLASFPLHVTGVELFNGQYHPFDYATGHEGLFRVPAGLTLPADKNYLTFHFNRVDKRYPQSVQFQHRLVNFDKTWSTPSATHSVTYSNLPSGEYNLQIKTTDKTGEWESVPLSYTFKIQAPFYETLPFQIGLIVLVAGGTGLFLYWRVRQKIGMMMKVERIRQQEQEKIRKEIARDFHDEMGNQLTRIINYISLIKLNGTNQRHQHELYNKVEESAKYLYNGTRDFIWSIDPMNDELSRLFIHLRDFGDKLFNEKNISFRAFNQISHPVRVSYGFSREANLIFKEAMTNAFNHSGASNVSFFLKEDDGNALMELQDDGRGFLVHDVAQPNGIKNMRSRAERIQATIRIKSTPGEGTTISLIFSSKSHKLIVSHV